MDFILIYFQESIIIENFNVKTIRIPSGNNEEIIQRRQIDARTYFQMLQQRSSKHARVITQVKVNKKKTI